MRYRLADYLPAAIVGCVACAPISPPPTPQVSSEGVVAAPPLPSTPRGLLGLLAGTWHFDVYSHGSSGPVASGQREMRLWADSMKLTWTETFDGQSKTGMGILGYNAATGAYYVLGAVEHQPNPMILVGRADSSRQTVVFDAGRITRPAIYLASELRLVDADHFEWATLDGSSRAVFDRVRHS